MSHNPMDLHVLLQGHLYLYLKLYIDYHCSTLVGITRQIEVRFTTLEYIVMFTFTTSTTWLHIDKVWPVKVERRRAR
jgi:hypothetical protein